MQSLDSPFAEGPQSYILWQSEILLNFCFQLTYLRAFHPQLEVATYNGKIVTYLYLYCNISCFLNDLASKIWMEADSLVKPAEYLHFH